jgi:hypothetical protein
MKNVKVRKPFFADGNATSAPVFVSRIILPVAAAFHCVVGKVKFCSNMFGMRPSFSVFSLSASARKSVSAVQVVFANNGTSAAVAPTKKMSATVSLRRGSGHNQFSEALSNHCLIVRLIINEFKSLRTFGLISP